MSTASTDALRARDRLMEAQARALRAAQEEERGEQATRPSGEDAARRERTIILNNAANHVTHLTVALDEIARGLCAERSGILRVAEYLHLGSLRLDASELRLNNPVTPPLVLPFFGHGNISVLSSGAVEEFICSLVWHVLDQTAPGQVQVLVVDPSRTNALAPLALLEDDSYLKVVSTARNVDETLADLAEYSRRVANLLQGSSETIVEHRDRTHQAQDAYRLVVLLDGIENLPREARETAASLLETAPRLGVSFICVGEAIPQSEVLEWDGEACAWRDRAVELAIESSAELAGHASDWVRQASSQSLPVVHLAEVDHAPEWEASSAEGLSFVVGADARGTVEITLGDERTQRHNILISGAVGQGKSNLIKVIINSLCMRYAPSELTLYLLDFKEGVTLYPFSNLGHTDYLPHARVLGLESDRRFGLATLQTLMAEMERRSLVFRPYGDNIARFRQARPDEEMPRIVVIIDEYHFMLNENDGLSAQIVSGLETLARKGRAYGIHLILASQSITGALALVGHEDGIYGQFPIRIALKNHLAESYATLGQGNDAAARIRVRGQAVLNEDYGMVSENRLFTVAWEPDSEWDMRRIHWWHQARKEFGPPVAFEGKQPLILSHAVKDIRGLTASVENGPTLYLGRRISTDLAAMTLSFGNEPGRNLAILGSGESVMSAFGGAMPGVGANTAIGIIQAVSLALALQHERGSARFVLLDLLDWPTFERLGMPTWIEFMAQAGATVRHVSRQEVASVLVELSQELTNASAAGTQISTYLLAPSMDRAGSLEAPDPVTFMPPAEALRTILRDGPAQGMHVIGWWSNVATYEQHLGFGGEGYVETKVVLRLDEATTQRLLGPYVSWDSQENRALVADQIQLTEPQVIIPVSSIAAGEIVSLSEALQRS